ncbi:alkaline phosphatase family protein [Bacillus sp. FJAT-49736]|uniref:alkaline phosphatase family protein n=1 Tax=Bacillus sp. FJAT-49736 TaxID=2833582 RepID=UPI001BCA35D7|nr:alkaline phosphatase family protein [Bacillus sp. FJAT-49736]MBS4172707.1 acid phosphatase [Bacillus sp. FJAT-49736]
MKKIIILLMVIISCLLSSCSGENNGKTIHKKLEQNVAQIPNKALPHIDHIVIVVEENHSHKEIINNPSAPYINWLMEQGANMMNYHAIEHPSQPNYLDLFSGSNQGVTSDSAPDSKFSKPNLASELLAKNLTFAGYSEGMPYVGYDGESTKDPSGYARKHNPWVNFSNVPKSSNQPLESFPTDFNKLPTVSFVIPTLRNDMHDGTIRQADDWLKQHLDAYVKWAKTHNSLLIVTWDEDDNSASNKIPTFFVGPMIKKGTYSEKVNHFDLLRTIEDLYGLSHAGASKNAHPITNIWR